MAFERGEPFTGSKVQRFKGCILITIRHFVNVLYGKAYLFHIPTNLEHGIWQICGKTSIFYDYFGSSILSLALTLNVEPCRRSRLKRSGSREPMNAYPFLLPQFLENGNSNSVLKSLRPALVRLALNMPFSLKLFKS